MAYPLTIKTLPHRRALTFFVFFTMLFNGGLVPTYLMYVNYLHIKNTIFALLLPNLLLSANNVLMIRSYFITSIPDALFEAAKIDGAGHMKIFTSVVLPLGKPILVTMGLFSGLAYWNDWTNGLYYLSGNQGQKLFGIQNLLNQVRFTDIQYLASGKVVGNIGAEVAKLPTTSHPNGYCIHSHAAAVYRVSIPSKIFLGGNHSGGSERRQKQKMKVPKYRKQKSMAQQMKAILSFSW